MQQITILGSTGFVGLVLTKKALERGYRIKTLVREPGKLGEMAEKVEIVRGDIFDLEKVEKSITGSGCIMSTVPPLRNTKNPQIYEKAMISLIDLMGKNGINRLVHIGGAVVDGGVNEQWTIGRRVLRFVLDIVWKGGLTAKHLEWKVLKESDIDYALIRPPRILNGSNGRKFVSNENALPKVEVYVEDLADFMLDQLTSKEWVRKAPLVCSL